MIIKVSRKQRDFFQVSNTVVSQSGMSFKAKGVLCYLLSKPESWVPRVSELASLGPDGRESIQTSLQELSRFGFATLESERDSEGKLCGKVWKIYEDPAMNPEFTDKRVSAPSATPTDERLSRLTAFPSDGKPDTSNTDSLVTPHQKKHQPSDQVSPRELLPDSLKPHWDMWREHLHQKKVKRTPLASQQQVKALLKMGEDRAIAAIEFSISNSYQGIYEPRQNFSKPQGAAAVPPWKRLEIVKEKIASLTSEFQAIRDEGKRAAIRDEITMLKAERDSLQGGEKKA